MLTGGLGVWLHEGAAGLRFRFAPAPPPRVDAAAAAAADAPAAPSNHSDASDSPPSMRTAARQSQSARPDPRALHLVASPPHARAVSPRRHNIHAATDARSSEGAASASSLSSSSPRAFELAITSPTARAAARAGAPPAPWLAGSLAPDLAHDSDSATCSDVAGADALCDGDGDGDCDWARMQNVLNFMTATYGTNPGDGQADTGSSATRSALSPGLTSPARAYRRPSPDASAAATILRGLDVP